MNRSLFKSGWIILNVEMLENEEGDLTHWPKPNLKLRRTFQSIEDVYYCQLMSAVLYKAEPYKHEFLLVGCKAPKYSGVIFFSFSVFGLTTNTHHQMEFFFSIRSLHFCTRWWIRDISRWSPPKMTWHQYLKHFPVISQTVSILTHWQTLICQKMVPSI